MTAGGADIPSQRVAAEEPAMLASRRAVEWVFLVVGDWGTGDDSSPAVHTRARDRPKILASFLYPFPLGTLSSIWTPGQRVATRSRRRETLRRESKVAVFLSFTSSRITSGRPCHVFADMPMFSSSTML
jgi:hypothetical protein